MPNQWLGGYTTFGFWCLRKEAGSRSPPPGCTWARWLLKPLPTHRASILNHWAPLSEAPSPGLEIIKLLTWKCLKFFSMRVPGTKRSAGGVSLATFSVASVPIVLTGKPRILASLTGGIWSLRSLSGSVKQISWVFLHLRLVSSLLLLLSLFQILFPTYIVNAVDSVCLFCFIQHVNCCSLYH